MEGCYCGYGCYYLPAFKKKIVVQNFLRKHRFLQKRIDVSKCRLCDYEEESSLHIISHCPAFELTRIMTFSNQELDLTVVDLDQLLGFIRTTKIGRMLTTEEIQR